MSIDSLPRVYFFFVFLAILNLNYSFSYDGLIREIHSSLRKEECNNNLEYYVSDIVNISCLLIKDGLEFIFIHRSFQEYFAAAFLAQETEQKQNQLCTTFIKDEMDSFDEISSKKFLGIQNVMDCFGDQIEPYPASEGKFYVSVRAEDGPAFYAWVFRAAGEIRIIEPKVMLKKYRKMLRKGLKT